MGFAGRHDAGERIALVSFVAMSLLAGGSGVAIRFSNRELAPLWGASLRFLLAAGLLLVIMAALRLPFPRGRALLGVVLYGTLTFGAAFGLAYYALVHVHAGLGQTVLALVPLATVLLAAAQGQERLRGQAVVGGVIALAGIAVMAGPAPGAAPTLLPISALIGSAICFAQAGVLVRRFPPVHPVTTNAIGMFAGAVLLSAASGLAGEDFALPSGTETWIAVGYLVVGGSVAVFVLYLLVLRHWAASRASYEFVLIPFVTLALSAWLDAEPIGAGLVVGGLFVLAGVYVGSLRPLTPNPKSTFSSYRSRLRTQLPQPATKVRAERSGYRLRWLLAILVAAAVPMLRPAGANAAYGCADPEPPGGVVVSVRVTPNSYVEFKWRTFVTWYGEVAVFTDPDPTAAPFSVRRDENDLGNPLAATEHLLIVTQGIDLPGEEDAIGPLASDTSYYFRVRGDDPTGSEPCFTSPLASPNNLNAPPQPALPFFTGQQTIGDVSVTPSTDGAVVSWDANVIGNGRVEILAPSGSGPFDDSVNTADHAIELSGLEAATTYEFRALNRHAIDGDALASETGSFTTLPAGPTLAADVQAPINADGSSTFNASRGVVPFHFTLVADGSPTCDLPPSTLRLTRTGGSSPGPIDEGVYSGPSDSGSDFRITDCAYHYNAVARALGAGTYLAEILIDGTAVGDAQFELK